MLNTASSAHCTRVPGFTWFYQKFVNILLLLGGSWAVSYTNNDGVQLITQYHPLSAPIPLAFGSSTEISFLYQDTIILVNIDKMTIYVSLIKSYLNSWPFDHSPSRCLITFLSASKLPWKKQSVFLFYLLPIFKASFGWFFVVDIFLSKCKFFQQKVASISSAPYCSSVPFLIKPLAGNLRWFLFSSWTKHL